MTPKDFHDDIAQPNMQGALERPGNVRALVNAVLSLDALAGIIHAHGSVAAWLRATRLLRKHGQDRHADFLVRHAAVLKAWAGARPVPV